MATITYLGPEGTFTHQAARDLARPEEVLAPLNSVPEVVQSVESGDALGGVVALENSLEGPVPSNLDQLLLETDKCKIAGERVLPVTFSLFRSPDDTESLVGVSSHPFGLAQCSDFITARKLQTSEALSTADACRELQDTPRPGWAALAPPTTGEIYGLSSKQAKLENDHRAATRFIVLRKTCPASSGQDRSAFSFKPMHDQPGSLVHILKEFSLRRINLTAIKSRPTKELLGEYVFYVECEGHLTDPTVREALAGILREQSGVRFLGSFPEDAMRPARPNPDSTEAERAYEEMLAAVET